MKRFVCMFFSSCCHSHSKDTNDTNSNPFDISDAETTSPRNLLMVVRQLRSKITWMSTTDAVGGGLSSCAKVCKLATKKKAEMVVAMEAAEASLFLT